MINKTKIQLSSFDLRLIAMISMLCDHAAKTLTLGFNTYWLFFLGRLAFPIFAFQLSEGYCHTKNFNKYFIRMLIFAVISEIPYNLAFGLNIISPFIQNVLWTFLISLIVLKGIDTIIKNNQNFNKPLVVLLVTLVMFIGYFVGEIAFVDYGGSGVLMVVLFYLTRNVKLSFIIQLIGMIILNVFLIQGGRIQLPITTVQIFVPIQSIALLSLIFIWLYKGKQGYHSRWWSNLCYWYYPIHISVLVILGMYIFN